METRLWVVQRHWQKDPYHLPGSPVVHGTQGAQLPCRPHCPGGPDPQPCTEPPGGPAPLPSTTARGPVFPAVHAAALQKAKPHWAPSPAARGLFLPWALPFILPLPCLVPKTPAPPLLRTPASHPQMEPPPGYPLSTFTHGEQPRASPRRRPSRSICPQKAVP